MLKRKRSELWKQGNTLPTQRIVGFRDTYMMNPKISKAIQKSNLAYLDGLSVKKEIGKKVASKISLVEQGVVDQPTDNRTLSERQNDEAYIQSQFLKVCLDLVKDQPEAYKLMSLIKQRDNKAFIQVSPMIKKELEKYTFVDASLINNIFNSLKVKARNKIFDVKYDINAQTGLVARYNKDAYPIQDTTTEADNVIEGLQELQDVNKNDDDVEEDIATRNLEFLQDRSDRVAEQERLRKFQEQLDRQRQLLERQRQEREEQERKRQEEINAKALFDERRKKVFDEIANMTPASASKSKQPPLKTPQKEISPESIVDTPTEDSYFEEPRYPIRLEDISFTERGLLVFHLGQLKSIYKQLTGKSTKVRTEATLIKKIIKAKEEDLKPQAPKDIVDLTEQSDAEAVGRGFKKHSKATKHSKASKHFIHFK